MSTKPEDTENVQMGEIGVDEERIVEELIFNQAEGVVDAWREISQNAIDSPGSDEVHVVVQPSQKRTIVWDNGSGMDLGDEEVRQFLEKLGKSTKLDDGSTIGQFGIGFGQALAVGKVEVHTQNSIAQFDAKNWFRQYQLSETDEFMDGFRVTIDHYDDAVPEPDSSEWQDHLSDLKERMKFMELVHGVKVFVNGQRVSNKKPADEMTKVDREYEDEQVHIAVRTKNWGDRLSVYSGGLKVTRKDGYGLSGYVITKENLTLPTSRNSIKEDCPVWAEVKEKIDMVRADVFRQMEDTELTQSGRRGVVNLIGKGYAGFDDYEVIKAANGEYRSTESVTSAGSMAWAGKGDHWSGKLADHGFCVLMDDDDANTELKNVAEQSQHVELPEQKDGKMAAAARGISTGYKEVDEKDVAEQHSSGRQLAIARILASKMGIDREIRFGEDKMANAWTDGDEYIVITDTAWNASGWEGWTFQIWRVLAHEAAHNEESKGDPTHGSTFNRQFRKYADNRDAALVELMSEIKSTSIKAVIESYRSLHGLEDVN